MPMPINITCPDCGHHFNPLPPKPETPPEWNDSEPVTPAIAARIQVVNGLLTKLADSFRRSYGFHTNVHIDNPTRTWTLTVSVPDLPAITDDAALPHAQ